MANEESILSPDQEAKIRAILDDKIARAEAGAPKRGDFATLDEFKAEYAAYKSNPLTSQIRALQEERELALQNGATPEQADEIYNSLVDDMRNHFMAGAKKGAPDENAVTQQQNIMDSLTRWPPDLMGIVKALLMMIPEVGDTLAAGGKWLRAKLSSDIEDMDFKTAKERIRLERAFSGAAANIGVDAKIITNHGISAYENPNVRLKPRTEPFNAETDAANQAKAKAAVDEATTEEKPKRPNLQFDVEYIAKNGTTTPTPVVPRDPKNSGAEVS